VAKAKSYSERMFIVERLGNLPAPDDRLALTEPAARAGRALGEAVVAAVVRDTAGYPFFIQMYGDALWKGAAGTVIGMDDLRRLRPKILQALDRGFFEARYARGSARERDLLRLIARHVESATIREIAGDSGLLNNQLQLVISNVLRKGLLFRPSRATLAFTAPMFGAHMRRRRRWLEGHSPRRMDCPGIGPNEADGPDDGSPAGTSTAAGKTAARPSTSTDPARGVPARSNTTTKVPLDRAMATEAAPAAFTSSDASRLAAARSAARMGA
jgi:hypothetical protein